MTALSRPTLEVSHRGWLTASIMLATIMQVLDTTIANVALPHMQGALSATQDEISWTVTFNIVATAVATPMTGWLAARLGRRNTMMWCMLCFSASTFFCGLATSLEELVFWRIVQGAAGAPLVPLGQTLLLDAYPRRQHGTIMAIYGMANMIGPMLGPTLGGSISEMYGWRWGFWMILPVALPAVIGARFLVPADTDLKPVRLDWTGFLSFSIAIAAAQLVFSRGQRLDWYESTEIWIATIVAILAFYVFVVHSLTTSRPFLTLRLLRDRNYSLGLIMVTLYGMLNFLPMVILPPLLQQHAGYPDALIGQIVGWRGIGAAIGFFIAMFIERVDPRVSMVVGSLLQVFSGAWMMHLDLSLQPDILVVNSLLQGISVGVVWVPMTVVTFATLDPKYRAEAMATFHLLRNMGSSLFISICVAEIVRATGANYARLAEFVSPFNKVMALPWATGSWTLDTTSGLARFGREVTRQATMIGYSNAFLMYTAVSLAAIPLCLLVRRPRAARAA